jgi:hypothetical protein
MRLPGKNSLTLPARLGRTGPACALRTGKPAAREVSLDHIAPALVCMRYSSGRLLSEHTHLCCGCYQQLPRVALCSACYRFCQSPSSSTRINSLVFSVGTLTPPCQRRLAFTGSLALRSGCPTIAKIGDRLCNGSACLLTSLSWSLTIRRCQFLPSCDFHSTREQSGSSPESHPEQSTWPRQTAFSSC